MEPQKTPPALPHDKPVAPWPEDPIQGLHKDPRKRWLLWAGVVVLVVAIALTAWYLGSSSTPTTGGLDQQTSADDTSAVSPLTSGNDNASLDQDLKRINSGITQSGNNLASADQSLDDQQNKIQVPTN